MELLNEFIKELKEKCEFNARMRHDVIGFHRTDIEKLVRIVEILQKTVENYASFDTPDNPVKLVGREATQTLAQANKIAGE